MTLENLRQTGKLKPHEPSRDELQRLLASARRNLQDAQPAALSAESRFDIAYKAIMQCALLAMMAHGYRPSTNEPGRHALVIQSLPKTLGISSEEMVVLDALRKKRNLNDYSGEAISETETESCLCAARRLVCLVENIAADAAWP